MIIRPTYNGLVEHTTCDIPEYYVTFNLSIRPLKELKGMLLAMIDYSGHLPQNTEELRKSLMDLKELVDMLEAVNNAIRYIEAEETGNDVREFLLEIDETKTDK